MEMHAFMECRCTIHKSLIEIVKERLLQNLSFVRGRAKYKKKSKNITHFKTILKRARCKWRLKMTS